MNVIGIGFVIVWIVAMTIGFALGIAYAGI